MSFAGLQSARKHKESRSFVAGNDRSVPLKTELVKGSDSQNAGEAGTSGSGKSDFQRPKGMPTAVEIRQSNIEGRGIYTNVMVQPGTTISFVRPRVAVLSVSALNTFCSHCCSPAPETGLKRCTRCKVLHYCAATCQNKDWSSHRAECEALQRWAAAAPSIELAVPSDAIRCLGRILWTRQKRGPDSEFVNEWNMLQSHRTSLPAAAVESHTHLAHSVVRYIGASSPTDLVPFGLSSAGELVDLISRFTTNAFTLTTPSLDPIGVCVAPVYALINHSCDPNAVLVFPRSSTDILQEPQMQLIALRQIAVDDEILIAYVDTTLPKEARQSALKETYNFSCSCPQCRLDASSDPRQSIWCPKSCGGTCPAPLEDSDIVRCIKCTAAVKSTDAVVDALRVGQEAFEKASNLRLKDPAQSLRLTTNILPILQSSGLTPSCHPLLALTRLHQELLMASFTPQLSQDLLDQTIQAATSYSAGLSSILCYGHPVRAAALSELGKLLAADEISPSNSPSRYPPSGPQRLRLAYDTLVRAREESLIGFGKVNGGGRIGEEVRELLVRLEKELGVWTQGIREAVKDQQVAAAGKSK